MSMSADGEGDRVGLFDTRLRVWGGVLERIPMPDDELAEMEAEGLGPEAVDAVAKQVLQRFSFGFPVSVFEIHRSCQRNIVESGQVRCQKLIRVIGRDVSQFQSLGQGMVDLGLDADRTHDAETDQHHEDAQEGRDENPSAHVYLTLFRWLNCLGLL